MQFKNMLRPLSIDQKQFHRMLEGFQAAKAATIFFVILGFSASSFAQQKGKPPANDAKLVIKMKGFRSDQGQSIIALYNSEEGYPTKPKLAYRGGKAPIKNKYSEITFKNLPPGSYAVAVFHDENKNNKLDTNWIGIPKEGTGASNDAKARFGPPKFKDAKITLKDKDRAISVKLNY